MRFGSACTLLVGSVAALALVGCGTESPEPSPSPATKSPVTPAAVTITPGTELVALATVLEAATSGPELCLGAVADSYPPQCRGLRIKGWSWQQAPKSDEAVGVRWGAYAVVGTFDGTTFTLTRPATTVEGFDGVRRPRKTEPDLVTPCPAPDGGWRVLDPAKTTMDTMYQAAELADRLPGAAGTYLDQSLNTADLAEHPELANDPTKTILNVQVTRDPKGAERALREVWGGSLCVTQVKHSTAELTAIQDQLTTTPGFLSVGPGSLDNTVQLQVILDDGSVQRAMDARYGPGLVRVTSALYPYQPR